MNVLKATQHVPSLHAVPSTEYSQPIEARQATSSRRMIVVDIENFNGGPVTSVAQAKWCRKMLTQWLDIRESEIVIVASDVTGILNIHAAWKGPRLLCGHGPNGADYRLVDEIEHMVYEQFDEIALVSGDGIFSHVVSRAAGMGVPTTVYTHKTVFSQRLRPAANTVRFSNYGYCPAPQEPTGNLKEAAS